MRDWRRILGVVIGLAVTVAVLALAEVFRGEPDGPAPTGPLTSDSDGRLQELVIHYVPKAAGITETVYRQFLGALPADVTVRVVCPDIEAFEDLKRRVGDVPCRLEPIPVNHPMTTWSRDRWLAQRPHGRVALTLLPVAAPVAFRLAHPLDVYGSRHFSAGCGLPEH